MLKLEIVGNIAWIQEIDCINHIAAKNDTIIRSFFSFLVLIYNLLDVYFDQYLHD